MNDSQPSKEFGFKRSQLILDYIRQFSSTEKAVFGMLVIIVAITAVAMAAQVNSFFIAEIPARGGLLREGEIGLPRTVNPVLAVTDVDKDIAALVYSGLMRYSGGKMVSDLAKSYDISPDGLTYTFTLKDGLHFQDGSPLTADDVAYTIEKIQDPALKSPHRADWDGVTVKILSPQQVRFILKQPYAPFLTNTTIGILPKHTWNALSDDQFVLSKYNIEPIGSGAYKESSIMRDSGAIPTAYSLTTWNGYYGKAPFLATIVFSFFADSENALSALDSGSIDSLPSISPADAARLASDSAQPYTVLSAPLPRIFGVFFNQNESAALADKNVRQALNMSADRTSIIKNALLGYGSPINGPLPIGMVTATAPSNLLGITQAGASSSADISAAQSLLEKNGWKKDPTSGVYQKKSSKGVVTILSFDIYTADTPDLKQTAESLKKSWNAMGAQVDVKIFEPNDLYQNVIRTRKYDALLFGEQIGKDRDLYAFWHSSQRNAPGLNVAMYTNSKADKLLEDIRTTGDESARAQKYSEFSQIISADIPAVFLYVPDFIYAVPKTMHAIDLGTITTPSDRFNSIGSWYNTTDKVWKIFANAQSTNQTN